MQWDNLGFAMGLFTFVCSLSYWKYLMYPRGVSSRQKPLLWLLCILCWGWEKLLLRKYMKGWILQDGHSAHTDLSPYAMEALSCHCPLQSSIALQTTSVSGWEKIKGLKWCYKNFCLKFSDSCPNLRDLLEQMVGESVKCWRRKQKWWVNKMLLSVQFF